MLDAVHAEALKLHRHRATWLMVWIYPLVILLVSIGVIAYGALTGPGAAASKLSAARWIADTAFIWKAPASGGGRVLIGGFTALVFAGEYGWNTWKLIIPARTRWQLVAAKWIVVFGFVVLAFMAADLIALLSAWLQSFQGDEIPAGVTLAAVAKAHWTAAGHALVPIVYTIAFGALFAVLTRSTLGTAMLAVAMVVVEGMLPLLAMFAYRYAPGLTAVLVEGLPMYHLLNLGAWARGAGLVLPLGAGAIVSAAWETSMAATGAWIVAAGAATMFRFLRQDLN